jgi:hypothetical protein
MTTRAKALDSGFTRAIPALALRASVAVRARRAQSPE